ncbi:MAG: hypothetical protein Q7T61_00950 [Caulobacter sp.]|nr:hypothetical protein [Caulobacter sp.]
MPRGVPNTRSEEVATERRRRQPGTLDRMQQLKLVIPEDKIKPGHQTRWINDKGNRMHEKTVQDDWSKIEGVDPIPVDTDEFGKPVYAYACQKPTAFVDEDREAALRMIDDREKGLLGGKRTDPQDTRSDDVSYVVPGNTLKRGYTP